MMNPQTRIPPSAQLMKASDASSPGAVPTPGAGGGFDAASGPMQQPEGPANGPDISQLIGQLAMIIQQRTGRPPTPQMLQAALAQLMGGGGAPGSPPPAGVPPAAAPMGAA